MKKWTSWIAALLIMQVLASCSANTPAQETSPAATQPPPAASATAVPEPTTPPEPTPLNPQTILQNSLDLLKNISVEIALNHSEKIDKNDSFDQESEITCDVDVEVTRSYCIWQFLIDERVPVEGVWQNGSVWLRQGGPWWQSEKSVEWKAFFLPGVFQLNDSGQLEENYLELIQTATLEERSQEGSVVYEITAVLDAEQYYIHVYSSDETLGQGLMERLTEEDSIEATVIFIIDTNSGKLLQAEETQLLVLNGTAFHLKIQYTFSEITRLREISDPPE